MTEQIAEALRRRRRVLGWSARQVARAAGISTPTVIAAEGGQLGTVGTLARHLEVLDLELRAVRPRRRDA
jgi:transcriptional regulator with XRE-family HTH domain